MNTQDALLDLLRSHGWRVDRTKRHWKLTPPFCDGRIVVMSLSPSDHRALDNMIGDVRRSYRHAGRVAPL